MTLTWLLYELSRHTDKQDKLYKELDSVSQEDIMKADKLDNLLYLDACVKEILRYRNNTILSIDWFATFSVFFIFYRYKLVYIREFEFLRKYFGSGK